MLLQLLHCFPARRCHRSEWPRSTGNMLWLVLLLQLGAMYAALVLPATAVHASSVFASRSGVSVPSSLVVAGVDVGALLSVHTQQIDALLHRVDVLQSHLSATQEDLLTTQTELSNVVAVAQQQNDTIRAQSVLLTGLVSAVNMEGDSILVQSVLRAAAAAAVADAVARNTTHLDALAAVVQNLQTTLENLLSPEIVDAAAGSSSATVRWSMLHAVVTAAPGGQQCNTSGVSGAGQFQCKVPGLTNGQPYNFTVQISNRHTTGPPSLPSNTVVPQLQCVQFTVASSGSGGCVLVTPTRSAQCEDGYYVPDEIVEVAVLPSTGFAFQVWTNATDGTVVSAATTWTTAVGDTPSGLTANFAQCFSLVVTAQPHGNVSVSALSPSVGCAAGQYAAGDRLTLVGTPDTNYSFDAWTGTQETDFTARVWAFQMPESDAAELAHFSICLPLTLAATPGGSLTVSSQHSNGCLQRTYHTGTVLTLVATPDPGPYTFVTWSGSLSNDSAVWVYTIPNSGASVQVANFAECFQLTFSRTVGGVASYSPAATRGCYPAWFIGGFPVQLSATADAGYSYIAWSGAATSTSTSYTLSFPPQNSSVVANFGKCYALSTSTSSIGDGAIGGALSVSPDRTGTCIAGSYLYNQAITVTGTPTSSYWYLGTWDAALTGRNASASPQVYFAPEATSTVSATFVQCYNLALTGGAGGSVSKAPESSPRCPWNAYIAGAVVSLLATPADSTKTFTAWSGLSTALTAATTVTMPFAASATSAAFAQCYALALSGAGGTTTTTVPATGSCPAGWFIAGAVVTVVATPAPHAYFDGWSGALSGLANPASLTMGAAAAAVNAAYVQCYLLTTEPLGAGSIAVAPTNSPKCELGYFIAGAAVSLSATGDSGNTFTVWGDATTSTAAATVLTMPAAAANAAAYFAPCFQLNMNAGVGGVLSASPPQTGQCAAGHFISGAVVSVTAVPSAHWFLTAFGDFFSGTANPQSLTFEDFPLTVSASFTQCFLLTLTPMPSSAGGTVVATPSSSPKCEPSYYVATEYIGLLATPTAAQYTFSAWSGLSASTHVSIYFTMGAASNAATATFSKCYALTISGSGVAGSTTASPILSGTCPSGSYIAGEAITLTSAPGVNAYLASWSGGGLSGRAASIVLSMPAAVTTVVSTYLQCYTFGVAASGPGSVSQSPAQSTYCAAGYYIAGQSITIAGQGSSGYTFSAWSGVASSAAASATVAIAMPAANGVATATFVPCYRLTLAVSGSGSISASPSAGGQCATYYYPAGFSTVVSAAPSATNIFAGFSGALGGATAAQWVTVPAGGTWVTASFSYCYYVNAYPSGTGSGTITLSPDATAGCPSHRFTVNSYVVATAVVYSGAFSSWAGLAGGGGSPVGFYMPASDGAALQATFTLTCYALSFGGGVGGGGTWLSPTSSGGCPSYQFVPGTRITGSASNSAGSAYSFLSWSGTWSSSSPSITVTTIAASMTLKANYQFQHHN